mmetsp:Transcript_2197/g.4529  ORF Transcript_2197/g.4529 Transcript_2197/m.4529 type:complete len:234 (-) Transcript_2197:138-839(-)
MAAASSSVLAGAKLSYFPIPGRGEPLRLAFALSSVEWTDNRIQPKDWGALKPSTPWGSMPMIELSDGKQMGQLRSMLRFVGRLAGLYPEDPLLACRVDEIMDVIDDTSNAINKVGQGFEQSAKEAARAEAVSPSGGVGSTLSKIDAFIAANGSDGHTVGATITVADLMVASMLANLCSGFFDGVPPSTLERYSNIQAVRKTVMSDPKIVAYYASRPAAEVTPFETYLTSAKDL